MAEGGDFNKTSALTLILLLRWKQEKHKNTNTYLLPKTIWTRFVNETNKNSLCISIYKAEKAQCFVTVRISTL